VLEGVPSTIHDWVANVVALLWPGAHVGLIEELQPDASERRYWRVRIVDEQGRAPASAVVAYLGVHDLPAYARALKLLPEPLPEALYLNVNRFLREIGVAVPEVYYAKQLKPAPARHGPVDREAIEESRLVLVEDVGELSLLDAAREKPERAPELFRKAIDELVRFHVDGTKRRDSRCFAFSVAYDERLFAYEMQEFIDYGMSALKLDADPSKLRSETAQLATQLGGLERVFSHRDYHGYNLFVQEDGKIRILDFQDALLAPPVQDLAVMLTTRDTCEVVDPLLEADLLAYYLNRAKRRAKELSLGAFESVEPASFLEQYRLAVLQHALKAIGRFARLIKVGKTRYAKYLPFSVSQARRMLDCSDDFPCLRTALCG